ncbi:RNA polymerase sigma factor [Brevibacillus sp. B_LB10_24]|uniref:RNA polymerase sigma factor n=1 Tax=Brevibacillus sp. B_LB10_24 TaxID=3380645 RepID=UPI0038BA3BD2
MGISDLHELVEQHGKAVYGFCYMLVKNKADADDLYQETFLKATELCHKIDMDQKPKAFLISIASKLWKNKIRKHAWRERIAPKKELHDDVNHHRFIDQATPEEIAISNEFRAMLQMAAHSLNDKLKVPLYMYYTAEMSIEEISSALNIPPGTVKSRLHKCRQELKKFVEAKSI